MDLSAKLAIAAIIVAVIYLIVTYVYLAKRKSGWTNCILPSNKTEAIKMWKTSGVNDDQIKFLVETYYPHDLKEKYSIRDLGNMDANYGSSLSYWDPTNTNISFDDEAERIKSYNQAQRTRNLLNLL